MCGSRKTSRRRRAWRRRRHDWRAGWRSSDDRRRRLVGPDKKAIACWIDARSLPTRAANKRGYAPEQGGLFGGVVAGFALWGYPAVMPSEGTAIALAEGAAWFGTNAEGLPIITPMGNIIVSLVFAFGFGLIPGFILGKILAGMGLLRVHPVVEVKGLDGGFPSYPALTGTEAAFEAVQRKEAKI